jgi:hypothetical protein
MSEQLEPEGVVDPKSLIHDHPFRAKTEEPWGLCRYVYHNGLKKGQRCNLSMAAHTDIVQPYKVVDNYRCPDCVTKDIKVCDHSPPEELG